MLFVYTSSSHFFSFSCLKLILQFPTNPPSLSSLNFPSSKPQLFTHPIPPSSLSFSTTIFTSQLPSIPSNLLPNNTFISFLFSFSFLHPRSPCTATPATVLHALNNLLPTLIWANSSFRHTLHPPDHHTRSPYKLPHHPSSVNFHLSIHSGHPHHLSNLLFCLIRHLL